VASASSAHVRAVVVTYGDRAGLCKRVVDAALAAGARDAVVVDNASVPAAAEELRALAAAREGEVTLVAAGFNSGSAGGFARGLEAAMADGSADALWLLDDDNEPAPDALAALLAAREARGTAGTKAAVLAYRERSYQRAVVEGRPVEAVFPARSSFLNMNVLDLPDRLRKRLPRRARVVAEPPPVIELPYAPYGGLLVHASLVREAGLPDERFWVYEDDADFTARLREAGARLLLVPAARIDELDASWYDTGQGGPVARYLDATDPDRLYYAVRNRIYFERTRWIGSPWLWRLNRALVLTAFRFGARSPERRRNYRIIRAAVEDGVAGRLGRGQHPVGPQPHAGAPGG
jgi:GT2 family glycosyltransferase